MSGITEAAVKAMSESDLFAALSLIQEEIKGREEGGFAQGVLDHLREDVGGELAELINDGGGAVRVTFRSDSWDNGYFYRDVGVLMLADGSTLEDIDFSDTAVADGLTELSQIRRRDQGMDRYSVLDVDLLTRKVSHDSEPR